MDRSLDRTERDLMIGIFGGVLTLIGDLLIGCVRFPEGADMLEGYLAAALAMPVWRPIVGGMIGFLGICLEFFGMRTIHPWFEKTMPRGAAFYKQSTYVYLAVAGGAVHLPCGALMWLYHSAAEAAGKAVAYDLTMRYLICFLLPVSAVFFVFFIGSGVVQFIAFARGKTPFPRWFCVFNLLVGTMVFNGARRFGNTPLANGIGTSNKSLGAIVMFAALLVGYQRMIKPHRRA